MKVGFYGHVRQYHALKEELDAAIQEVLESGEYVLGPALARFEKELAAYFQMKNAIGVNSGTDALWLVFLALGIGPGDEVITTANTFFATAEAIWFTGAKAVFVDIEPDTCNIDPAQIEAAITPNTKAIVPVHLYGQTADMRAVAEIARRHGLFVVEDCAQAIDAHGDGFAVGELSDAVCTSFIIQKNLGAFGDGGAIITNRDDIVPAIRALRNHGSLKRSYHSMGYNSRLDDLHAAILSVKLKRITAWSDRRREIAAMYNDGLKRTSLKLPCERPGYRHVYHLYVIETLERDAILPYLNGAGVDAKLHYPIAIHQQAGYPWGKAADLNVQLPLTEKSAASVISLPMFPELEQAEIDYVIDTCRAWEDR
ncbi:MAG: DegT/DnrJ/EryC1/StrS family aminotransferase [Chloroflexi bacterium]|nr:DegT/DnrJ/EryC1/StrS family aminotransferase [Chloroflexota bacterium]MCI0581095.1 DegT/DnrJ/EryC1/StrS family aminotransferase [Chloroflexota bacterium]MCI0649844.1 DegT/DnrJ/EryC1/StrS family aminotransferase [Chloroflexota bacterium]MCI0731347.1 DegT/DnrJ/EryC1/StrS family aminotransferase [Chloroflexota bacterium]